MFGLKGTEQEKDFREVCKGFRSFFSPFDVDYALSQARELGGEDYVEKLIAGAKAVQIVDQKYFKNEGNKRAAQFYGRGRVLLSVAQYKPGETGLGATLNTAMVLQKHEDRENDTEGFLKQRFCSMPADEEIIIER
ncbi:MAG: hypothetical protein WCI72_00265 [archaeon]